MFNHFVRKYMILTVLLAIVALLTACTSAPTTPVTQAVEFTPLPSPAIDFSPTPTPTALPTFAPISVTRSSSTPSLGASDAECFITASQQGIQLQVAPFISEYRLLPTMEPGVRYQAVAVHPTFFQLARDGVPVGWVEYMTIGLSSEGDGCARLFQDPPDSRPLTDFPGLCFFTTDHPTETFQDRALTERGSMMLPPSEPFVLLEKTQKSYFTSLGHAGPSFYVAVDQVSTFGACDSIPASATVTTPGWLLTQPNEQNGEKLRMLPAGLILHIEGTRPPDSSGQAAWVQAVVENETETLSGWVWSGLLTFE